MLAELSDLDEERLVALDVLMRQQEKVDNAYNKKVKSKSFMLGDLVWKLILPMDKNDRTLDKWSLNREGPFRIMQVFKSNTYKFEELTPGGRILRINENI